MKTTTLFALVAVAVALPTVANAQGKDKKAAPTCPACKMTLSATKSEKTPVGIALGKKKVMFCCSGCDMKSWAKDKKGNLIPPAAKP